jgi:hypothetical protein
MNECVLGMNQTDVGVNKNIMQPLRHHLPQIAGKVNRPLMRLMIRVSSVGNISLPPQTEAGEPSIIGCVTLRSE